MKITLISLRTEGSPSKFINNGSRQGESQALGQISKPGKWQELSKGLVLPGRRGFAIFPAGSGGAGDGFEGLLITWDTPDMAGKGWAVPTTALAAWELLQALLHCTGLSSLQPSAEEFLE